MRITREALLRVAQDTVNQRVRSDRTLIAAFMCGSMLEEEYLLGETTDLDLYYLHSENVRMDREVIPLTEDIHFDIVHSYQRDYRQTRRLRSHPWLGPTINSCRILYDPQHFIDFIQAGVRGQFDHSDFIWIRAHSFFEDSRRIWLDLQTAQAHSPADLIDRYFLALFSAGNAVASLTGSPLTERRFLAEYQFRTEKINQPGLYPGLLGLLGTPHLRPDNLPLWLEQFRELYDAMIGDDLPVHLHSGRRNYYLSALQSWLESSQPVNALWLLLSKWTQLAALVTEASPGYQPWVQALSTLGFMSDDFEERISALDSYLDRVDEALELWAQQHGASIR